MGRWLALGRGKVSLVGRVKVRVRTVKVRVRRVKVGVSAGKVKAVVPTSQSKHETIRPME